MQTVWRLSTNNVPVIIAFTHTILGGSQKWSLREKSVWMALPNLHQSSFRPPSLRHRQPWLCPLNGFSLVHLSSSFSVALSNIEELNGLLLSSEVVSSYFEKGLICTAGSWQRNSWSKEGLLAWVEEIRIFEIIRLFWFFPSDLASARCVMLSVLMFALKLNAKES